MSAWAVALSLCLTAFPRPAAAQCGAKRTTCSACHDGLRGPFPREAAWHAQHAFGDLCALCHGGDPTSAEAATAHVGVSSPLSAIPERCGTCHGGEAEARAVRYAVRDHRSDAWAAGKGAPPPGPAPTEPHGRPGPNLVFGALAVTLAVGGALAAWRERARILAHEEGR